MSTMQIKDADLTGERALFHKDCLLIDHCHFFDGESPLKEGRNLTVTNSVFSYKYPLWYGKGHHVTSCRFEEMSRSGIWYTDDSYFDSCDFIAPKLFRRCNNIIIKNSKFSQAKETLWSCHDIKMENIQAEEGDYFGKDSSNITVKNLQLNGNYCFDGGRNIVVTDSILNSKDAFWNCENVTLKNCTIIGEYFGWNSKNITLFGCKVISHQGFCYMDQLYISNSTIENSDLIFEYCSHLDVSVKSKLLSVKNPVSGVIRSLGIEDLIMDDNRIPHESVHFEKLEEDDDE